MVCITPSLSMSVTAREARSIAMISAVCSVVWISAVGLSARTTAGADKRRPSRAMGILIVRLLRGGSILLGDPAPLLHRRHVVVGALLRTAHLLDLRPRHALVG